MRHFYGKREDYQMTRNIFVRCMRNTKFQSKLWICVILIDQGGNKLRKSITNFFFIQRRRFAEVLNHYPKKHSGILDCLGFC